ncbi:MAG TPA: hypothetical protein PLA01_08125 [Acetivibrio sp.]|nr:hypothetical protein [Acetivibrio sp.]
MRRGLEAIKKLGLALIIINILFCSCSNKGSDKEDTSPKQKQLGAEEEGDKIPEQLESIENSIESIIKTLDGPAVETKKHGLQQEPQDKEKQDIVDNNPPNNETMQNPDEKQNNKSKEEKQNNQNEKQDDEKQSNQDENKEQPSNAKEDKAQEDPWKDIDKIINRMHYQWNSFKPMAFKKNASSSLTDGFSSALNSLTNTVISKNKTNTLLAASYLYSFIPDLYALYKTQTSPEIKRIRYYTRNATLNAMTANWEQADRDIANLKSTWNIYKNLVSAEQQEQSSKLDFSIYELENVIKEKNQPLCDIKGRVVISNIQALEEAMEKGSKKEKSNKE